LAPKDELKSLYCDCSDPDCGHISHSVVPVDPEEALKPMACLGDSFYMMNVGLCSVVAYRAFLDVMLLLDQDPVNCHVITPYVSYKSLYEKLDVPSTTIRVFQGSEEDNVILDAGFEGSTRFFDDSMFVVGVTRHLVSLITFNLRPSRLVSIFNFPYTAHRLAPLTHYEIMLRARFDYFFLSFERAFRSCAMALASELWLRHALRGDMTRTLRIDFGRDLLNRLNSRFFYQSILNKFFFSL